MNMFKSEVSWKVLIHRHLHLKQAEYIYIYIYIYTHNLCETRWCVYALLYSVKDTNQEVSIILSGTVHL